MEQLKSLHRSSEISLYRVNSDRDSEVEEFVFSTPETRRVCNEPEMVGMEFPKQMRRANVKVLNHAPLKSLFSDHPDDQVSVMHFLRGGLNFQLRESLAEAYDFNKHYCAYMTSQRHKTNENWVIEQDQYRKIRYQSGSTIMIGDVIATGSTMENGLEVLLDHARENNQPFKNLIVFTIGCDQGREILEKYYAKFLEEFGIERIMLFYAEGKFGLANDDSPLTIKIPGTDLLREPALLSPELERSIYKRLHIPIERCAIYDVGAKSFEYKEHIEDVINYWEQLKASDLTLREAYRERWSESDYESPESLFDNRKQQWPFVEQDEIQQLYDAYDNRWSNPPLSNQADSHEALNDLANERLRVLEELMNE